MRDYNPIYSRQQNFGVSLPERVAIVGVGGVGTWVAIQLAMSGVRNLHLYDSDKLEIHNLNRLPFDLEDLQKQKPEVMKEFIERIRLDCIVVCYPAIDIKDLPVSLWTTNLIVDCTDDLATQRALCSACVSGKQRYIRAGYDGTHITVSSSVPNWGNDERRGYSVDSSFVAIASMVASFATIKALMMPDLEVSLDVTEIGARTHASSR